MNQNGTYTTLSFLEKYKYLEINDETHIPDEIPTVTIRDLPFACQGDVSFISGKSKSGKTQLVPFLIASAFVDIPDSLHLKTMPHNGNLIVHIDTEQSKATLNKVRQNTVKLIGKGQQPKNLLFYSIKEQTVAERRKFIELFITESSPIHLLIIDGVADLVTDVNNAEQSNELIDMLSGLAEKHQTTIIGFIHENQNAQSNEMRGHLGGQAARKSGGVLSVRKHREKGFHEIKAMYMRYSGEFESVFFCWDNEEKRMVSVSDSEARELTRSDETAQTEKLARLAKQIFAVTEELRYGEVTKGIENYAPTHLNKSISKSTAEHKVRAMLKAEILEKTEQGTYRLNTKSAPQ